MSSTSLSSAAQHTTDPGAPGQPAPPLLPAFLITGLLLAAIISIICWRHIVERRAMQREDDLTWPSVGVLGVNRFRNVPVPKLWELQFSRESARAAWGDIMPLSAAPLRGQTKPRVARYLVPSDRPVSLFTRLFGGERREAPPLPQIAVLTGTQRPRAAYPDEDEDDDDDEYDVPVDRLQLVVLIRLPHPHRDRHVSHLPEAGDLKTIAEFSDTEQLEPLPSSDKGKKRSLEVAEFLAKGRYYEDDEEGALQLAFGTATLPFAEGAEDRDTS